MSVNNRSQASMVCAWLLYFLGPHIYVAGADYTPIVVIWDISDMVLGGGIAGILCYYLQKVRRLLPPDPDYGRRLNPPVTEQHQQFGQYH